MTCSQTKDGWHQHPALRHPARHGTLGRAGAPLCSVGAALRRLPVWWLLLGFGAVALPVRSESTPDPPTQLPPLAVEERGAGDDALAPAGFVVATAAAPGSTALTLAETLRAAPGVLLQESFGGIEPPRLSIRGSGLQSAPSSRGVVFLLEGFPLNLADGSFNASLIDPALVDRLEISRGDAAALGGTIDLRLARRPAHRLAGLLAAGSHSSVRGLASACAGSGTSVFSAAADWVQQDGYREHSAQERSALLVQARRSMPAGMESVLTVYHVRADYDVPGPLTLAAAARAPRSVSTEVRRDQPQRDAEATQASWGLRQENPTLALEFGAAWLHSLDTFQQLRANGISESASDDLTLRAGLHRRWETRSLDHRLRLEAAATRGWRDIRRYANDSGTRGARFGEDGLQATTATVTIEHTAVLHRDFAATLGFTGFSARREIVDRSPQDGDVARTDLTSSTSMVQPHARLRWALLPTVAWHGGVSRASEPPTFDDLLVVASPPAGLTRRSQPLAAQRATTVEFGTTGSWRMLAWNVTVYQGEWDHEILRLADERGLPRGAVNAGPTRHRGLETAVRWRLLDGLRRLDLGLTANGSRFTFVGDPVRGEGRLAGTPPWQGLAELRYEDVAGFHGALALDWAGGTTWVDHAGRLGYGGRTLLHARAGWSWGRSWTVFIQVRNALDRAHIASPAGVLDVARDPAATSVFLPGVGRRFMVGAEWRWR